MAGRKPSQAFAARPGDRLGQVELVHAFVLAEVGAVVQLLQQHQLRSRGGRFGDARFDAIQVGGGIALVAFLHQGDLQGATAHASPSGNCMVRQCRLPFCQISGRHGIPTISRSGKALPSTAKASASAASS